MGKVKLLLDVIGDLRSLADSLQAVADAVADNGTVEAEMTTTKEPEKAGQAGKAAVRNTAKKEAKGAKQEPEEKPLTLEEGFGTGDCVIIVDGTLYIIDYKHGKGVEVSAEGNPQMMLYALGALKLFDGIYDIDTVRMAIYQPRRENVSVYAMAKGEFLRWAEGELSEKVKLAYAGEGEFCAGEHCKFCKAKAVCRKRAEYNLELAKYDFEMPATLEDDEIAVILVKADELAAWAADVKEFALQQALSGVKYAGFKVVAGRSNRKYTDEDAVPDTVKKAGFDPYEPKLLSITAMEKLLGKKSLRRF